MTLVFFLALQFHYSLRCLGLGSLCLGVTATCLWQLGSSVMTDSHPAKGQQQEQTSQLDKTAYAVVQGKKDFIFLSFVVITFLWLYYYVSEEREREVC